ncbi:IS4 family transposase, partial [Verminephrobacter eiseniae]|nr:IS4 family transposase [Verminephrobacter eiseniae]
LVCVGDREADIVEMMRRARDLGHPADWLIRSKHNRTLPDGSKSWAQTIEEAPLGEIEFTLAARTAEAARVVCQQIWARALSIPDGAGGQLTVT